MSAAEGLLWGVAGRTGQVPVQGPPAGLWGPLRAWSSRPHHDGCGHAYNAELRVARLGSDDVVCTGCALAGRLPPPAGCDICGAPLAGTFLLAVTTTLLVADLCAEHLI